jgi:isoquinoline 1-oxidoreductase beta subunit
MILADEMDLDWSAITFADEVPVYLSRGDDGKVRYKFAHMDSGGSHAVERNWDYLRRSGAAARHMLVEEAAIRWGIAAEGLQTRASYVIDPQRGRRFSYGELAEQAVHRTIDVKRIRLKHKNAYRIIGTERKNIDALDIVTGKPIYAIDAEYPGALQAMVARVPFGATIKSYDKEAVLAIPGVKHVVELDRQRDQHWMSGPVELVASGVAIVGDSLWAVMQARKVLRLQWTSDPQWMKQDSAEQMAQFRRIVLGRDTGDTPKVDGDVESALSSAEVVLDCVYEQPLFAHACMEPMDCLADVGDDAVTVVVGTQFPSSVAADAEKITGIDALKVKVIPKRMGGGFGRRAESDFVWEALQLSKKLHRPVKVTWTREDDIENDFFNPAAVTRIRAGLSKGKLVAWHHRQAQTHGGAQEACFPAGLVDNYKAEICKTHSLIRAGAWRAPMHMAWSFVVESMFDELAYETRVDPLNFRLELMKPHREMKFTGWGAVVVDTGRMARVYEAAARLAQWERKRPAGTGVGIAGHFTHGTYVAFVVEVSMVQNDLRINHAWGAIDCGLAINPNHIRSQMEGGFIDGLNAAMFNDVRMEQGRVTTNNFDTLRWMRLADAPRQIDVVVLKGDEKPTGVGEPPTPPAAAALANAIFAATGKRLRSMPFAQALRG